MEAYFEDDVHNVCPFFSRKMSNFSVAKRKWQLIFSGSFESKFRFFFFFVIVITVENSCKQHRDLGKLGNFTLQCVSKKKKQSQESLEFHEATQNF